MVNHLTKVRISVKLLLTHVKILNWYGIFSIGYVYSTGYVYNCVYILKPEIQFWAEISQFADLEDEAKDRPTKK